MDLCRRLFQKFHLLNRHRFNLVPYLLIGGGTASYYASLTIRARDPDARVLIVSDEEESPYRRSVISKELWWYGDEKTPASLSFQSPGSDKRRHVCYEADGFYLLAEDLDKWEHGGVALMTGTKVEKVDAENNFVQLQDGRKIEYGKCLIATGSIPHHKSILEENAELKTNISIIYDIEDYRRLHCKLEELANSVDDGASTSESFKNIVILGGDILATELAYSLNRRYARGKQSKLRIFLLVNELGVLDDILPTSLSGYCTQTLQLQGVNVLLNTKIDAFSAVSDKYGSRVRLKITQESENSASNSSNSLNGLFCDHLILASGAMPAIELAKNSRLDLDNDLGGIVADEFMHVKGNVWAAGDVCSFFDRILGYRRRCTHWLHAQITGRIAGENMTSGNKTYIHQADAHFCGIGDTNAKKFNTTTVYAVDENDQVLTNDEPRAVVFYTDKITNVIKGVLLFNVMGFGEEIARKLIRDMKPFKETLKEYSKLFELWEVADDSLKEDKSDLNDDELLAYQRED
uniref:FAD/NAD(P)-binding domain-containing protein n=1 Tax=Meloidogyne incognita TaxID=6306 RepID=A0A914LBJ7_MELIC